VEEFPAAEVGGEELPDAVAEVGSAGPEAEASEETGADAEAEGETAQDAAPEAGAPVRKRRRERRRTRPRKESVSPEAEGDEATPDDGSGTLAPASEEGEDAPPELVAEETELLDALDLAEGAEESPEAAGEDAGDEGDEGDEGETESPEGESAASRNRKRRRRRRRRSGLALREDAPSADAPEAEPSPTALADVEAELLSAETGADPDVEEVVEAEIDDRDDEEEDEDEEPAAAPSEDGSAAERRARRSRFPNRRDGRRRPAMEQAVIENPSDPSGSPLRVDIQPGVGSRLIGRSIIGFREAYDIGGGDRAGVSFHVMVLDDGSQWRVKGSEDFDPWMERILPGEED
jgi:ribonuclease E